MSLPNPNLPVTEERLQEFYQQIKPYLGLREMPSGDMSEIVSPKPVTAKGGHRYSTEEQIVGEWIDGSTLYEKMVECGALPNNGTKNVAHGITNLAYVVKMEGTAVRTSGTFAVHSMNMNDNSMRINTKIVGENIVVQTGGDFTSFTGNVIIQYTKS